MNYSVVIRTKNEQDWIGICLDALKSQIIKPKEIIIIDNMSSDNTLKICKKYDCKIFKYKFKKYNYSKAINIGIKNSTNEVISLLSAHCIPKDSYWSYNALKYILDNDVVGVYSRQLPTPNSSELDYRDLFQVFRKESSIQNKDIYFNNAASFIKKIFWTQHKFLEKINGLEDIEWAKYFLNKGKKIIYSSNSEVFHYHGINQMHNLSRLKRHINIIKKNFI